MSQLCYGTEEKRRRRSYGQGEFTTKKGKQPKTFPLNVVLLQQLEGTLPFRLPVLACFWLTHRLTTLVNELTVFNFGFARKQKLKSAVR